MDIVWNKIVIQLEWLVQRIGFVVLKRRKPVLVIKASKTFVYHARDKPCITGAGMN